MNQKRHSSLICLLLTCVLLLGAVLQASAQASALSSGPESDWVHPCDWTAPDHPVRSDNSEGSHFLLYEEQENAALKESYVRIGQLMENEAGVQDGGSLSFSFDPAYEQLIFHKVQIHRAGQVLSRLDLAKIKVIQPERNLDGHMLTGKQTALIFVEDLRVGDVLEYAYTLRGANPILAGHYATRFFPQTGLTVDRQRMRVVTSAGQPIYLRQHLMDKPPKQTSLNGMTDYLWDFDRMDAIPFEDFVPATFERYPYIDLTDFTNWAEVVDWALPLYAAETTLPPDMQALVDRWLRETSAPDERARRALQFVQDDLRYTALELGPDSYRPTPPAETFTKRFGDCKGKVLLLCVLLRAMNIEAQPALVNATVLNAVAARLPSPFAFDHVIVKLTIGGRSLWVDPTQSYQGGSLWHRYVSPFGKALVIKAGVTELEDVFAPQEKNVGEETTSIFDVKNYRSPVGLTVKTVYRGAAADNYRENLARTDPKDALKDYMNFYARYYPGIQDPAPLAVTDDRSNNVLIVSEHYDIRNLWETNLTKSHLEAVFYADTFINLLINPNTRLRKLPLRIFFPLHRKQEVIVRLPDRGWKIPDADQSVDNAAFHFRCQRHFDGTSVHFNFECETTVSQLPAADVAAYLDKREEMENLLQDTLYQTLPSSRATPVRINWLMAIIAGFCSLVVGAGCVWFWRASNVAVPAESLPPVIHGSSRLKGLGGWLILVGFGLCVSPFVRVITLAIHWKGYFSMAVWQAVASPEGAAYHPLYGPLLVGEMMGNILVVGLNLLALALFFGKRRVFPKVFILLLLTNSMFLVFDASLGGFIPTIAEDRAQSLWNDALRTCFMSALWIAYMIKSRRVKATFTRPRPRPSVS